MMRQLLSRVIAAICTIGCAGAAIWHFPPANATASAPAIDPHQAQVECRFLAPPRAVRGDDGKLHVAYELRIISFHSDDAPLRLVRLGIFADSGTMLLTVIERDALPNLLAQPPKDDAAAGIAIAEGQAQTLYLWLTLPDGVRPASLRHRLTFVDGQGNVEQADDVRLALLRAAPISIGPPLRGGRWLAVEGPGNHLSHHWGSLVAINGTLSIPQRFAIDWFGLDTDNHSIHGAHDGLASTTDRDWVGYRHDVLAVADGVVVDARDGARDGKPLAPMATPDDLTARTLYGNFVVIRIAPGIYAHYAHLDRGSVKVRIGQRVHRGMVIGLLGQTGAAGAPHLHFHISDRATFEQSEGLPYVIDSFTALGRTTIEDTFDPAKPVLLAPSPKGERRGALPLDGSVVVFR